MLLHTHVLRTSAHDTCFEPKSVTVQDYTLVVEVTRIGYHEWPTAQAAQPAGQQHDRRSNSKAAPAQSKDAGMHRVEALLTAEIGGLIQAHRSTLQQVGTLGLRQLPQTAASLSCTACFAASCSWPCTLLVLQEPMQRFK